MPDDFAKDTASPVPVTIAGRDYRIGKLGPRDRGDLEAYVKTQIPDPRLKARELCAGLPDAVAIEVWRDLSMEAANWPPDLASLAAKKILEDTWEGNAQLVYVLLRRHTAGFSLDDARAITRDDDEIATRLLLLSLPEPTFDPKAQTETTPTPE